MRVQLDLEVRVALLHEKRMVLFQHVQELEGLLLSIFVFVLFEQPEHHIFDEFKRYVHVTVENLLEVFTIQRQRLLVLNELLQ